MMKCTPTYVDHLTGSLAPVESSEKKGKNNEKK